MPSLPRAIDLSKERTIMNAREIRRALERLPTVQGKIEFLETLPERQVDHFILYTLASLYLEKGDHAKAESALREDILGCRDFYEIYESQALLTGLYMDQSRDIPEKEVEGMVENFRKMRIEAEKAGRGREVSGDGRGDPPHRNKKSRIYLKDPYQIERMLGDYYYGRGEVDKAYLFYERYYRDLEKPVETFVPDSMRRYTDTLAKKGMTEEALYFIGYIITLKPYMLEDVFGFVDLYYMLNDRISALLILMFAQTLAEGHSESHASRSRNLIEKLCAETETLSYGAKAKELVRIFLTGERIPEMLHIIEGLKKEGIRNFFFSYLEGMAHFAREEYPEALTRFTEFNETYPFLAESHYYAMVCMQKTDAESHGRSIALSAERAIELKPGSSHAEMAKIYLGTMLGISPADSPKLLISSEVGAILNDFLFHDAPAKVLDRLIASLTIRENPYQLAAVHLMAGVTRRKEDFVSYLKNVRDLLNEPGKRNIEKVLAAMKTRAG